MLLFLIYALDFLSYPSHYKRDVEPWLYWLHNLYRFVFLEFCHQGLACALCKFNATFNVIKE
jgi:hypothetical protein